MSAKSMLKFGLLAKAEATYGALATMAAATDGLLVVAEPDIALDYNFKGERTGVSPMNGGELALVGTQGRKGSVSLTHEIKGGCGAYSATVKPSASLLLRALGMSETIVTTPGSETARYDFISSGFTSLSMQAYTRQESTVLRGAFVKKMVIEGKGYGVPKFTCDVEGIAALPTDLASVPAITYPNTSFLAPKATNVGLSVSAGGQTFVAKCREFMFTAERALQERADINDANGDIAGFDLGPRKVSLEMTIEAAALTSTPFVGAAALDPYNLRYLSGACTLALAIGGTQYNKFSINGANAYLADVKREKEGPVATWKLTWKLVAPNEASEGDAYMLFN